jgi:hypothetical protein
VIRQIVGGLVLGAAAYFGVIQFLLPKPTPPTTAETLLILNQPSPLIQAPALAATIQSVGLPCRAVTKAVEHGRVANGDVLWSAACPEGEYGMEIHRDESARILTCADFQTIEHRPCFR